MSSTICKSREANDPALTNRRPRRMRGKRPSKLNSMPCGGIQAAGRAVRAFIAVQGIRNARRLHWQAVDLGPAQ